MTINIEGLCGLCSLPGGYEVLWDYCLENNICLPGAILIGSQSIRMYDNGLHSCSGTGLDSGFADHQRSLSGSTGHCRYPWSTTIRGSWSTLPKGSLSSVHDYDY